MIHASRDDTALHTFNRFEFTVAELQSITESLAKKRTSDDRRATPGLDPARADIIVAGALVLEGVADIFGIKSFVFSEAALREGVLLDTIARLQGGALHHLRDVSRRSIRALAERCDDDLTHSAHVAALALAAVRRHRVAARPADRRARVPRGRRPAGQRRPGDLAQQAPPAQLLRHPQQRAHRADRHRDRDHRPDRPLPPQECSEGQSRRVRPALARATSGW